MKMKNIFIAAVALFAGFQSIEADNLVILHTNDTHSQIDPDPKDGMGGVLNRKAIIDSVRKAEKNVLLVDAGDVVQGTFYFKCFKGEVEYPLMDMMGYDIRILGNHEFDNGIEDLAKYYKQTKSDCLSANYDFTGTLLEGVFRPYTIKKIGGKKIGFIGLNINPESLIVDSRMGGTKWNDIITTANETAKQLKTQKKCDLVVAVTHIGYSMGNGKTSDVELASKSCDIDIIIGGHTHTVVEPGKSKEPYLIKNIVGKNVLITQTGKAGKRLGYIKIDLDALQDASTYEYKLIPVTSRFAEAQTDKSMRDFIKPYREKVDSIYSVPVGVAMQDMDNETVHGAFANWVGDFAMYEGQRLVDSVRQADVNLKLPEKIDFGLMNLGGIRQSLPKGVVSEGQIMSAFPFYNRMVIVKIKGVDLHDVFKEIVKKSGEPVSNEVRVLLDESGNLYDVLIGGEKLDFERDYYLSTIDYLAWGNDDLTSLKKGEIVFHDEVEMSVPMMRYVQHLTELGMPLVADPTSRYINAVRELK